MFQVPHNQSPETAAPAGPVAERAARITAGLIEVFTPERLTQKLESGRVNSYWGVAPSGPPHIGYYRAVAKQLDMVAGGLNHTILIADYHAYLDDQKCPWDKMARRGEIYAQCFMNFGLPEGKVNYRFGSSFQRSAEYIDHVLRALPHVSIKRAQHAGAEVLRATKVPHLSGLIYPIMQNLDVWALGSDIVLGGTDQRHVYMLGGEFWAKVGLAHLNETVYLYSPLGKSLQGKEKMSASQKKGRLKLFDSVETVEDSIRKAFCAPQDLTDNPVMELAEFVVFPRLAALGETTFKITRTPANGGDLEFKTPEALKALFVDGGLHPMDLKNALAAYLADVLRPIRDYYEKNRPFVDAAFENE